MDLENKLTIIKIIEGFRRDETPQDLFDRLEKLEKIFINEIIEYRIKEQE